MQHSIISWDCSFRNFFHLIDSLTNQNYDKNEFELIHVEQRSQKHADEYNHSIGLKSLFDRYLEVRNKINMQIIYLNNKDVYHLGICNNQGIEAASGNIISVMDGDLLLSPNFLSELGKYHEKNNKAVVNLFRHMVPNPIGTSLENWMDGIIDFDLCYKACLTYKDPIPNRVDNKGPLISAKREYWGIVDGYDIHPVWNTAISRLGVDVTTRLELYLHTKSVALPNCFCVHPYHKIEINRNDIVNQIKLDLQLKLINWANSTNTYSWKDRTKLIDFIVGKKIELN